jgi:uncharacterized protein YcnI
MIGRALAVGFGALGLVVAWAGVAAAHVEVQPGQAAAGAPATFAFRVPNEKDNAATIALTVHFPTDRVIKVDVQPKPGWTVQVTMAGATVDTVTWSGGRIEPGHADYFAVSTGPLPTDVPELVFTADQTYSDGSVLAWNQPPVEGHPEPSNPAPVLAMTGATAAAAAPATAAAPPTTAAAPPTTAARASDDDAPIPLIGVAGAAAAVLALGAIALFRFRPDRSAAHH